MATSLLALLDDITSILDDVAAMSKIAAKKTAGVLGDDLALNAEQVSGVKANRELPVIWSVAKGSFINKCLLVPFALLISSIAPWLIIPLLMIGGAYLCFEGFEKVVHVIHKKLHKQHQHHEITEDKNEEKVDPLPENIEINFSIIEKDKIKGAIRTDFILSAEIVVISLGSLASSSLLVQIISLSLISIFFTIGVYGLVAIIVKLDDFGFYLLKKSSKFHKTLGIFMLAFAPKLMKTLSFIGTIAMFLVGGGIIEHGIGFLSNINNALTNLSADFSAHKLISIFTTISFNLLVGLLVGFLCFMFLKLVVTVKKLY